MSLTFTAGSAIPTTAQINALKAQTIGGSTENEIRIVLMLLAQKAGSGAAPGLQPLIGTILP